jgi:hypothetical protein
MLGWYLREARRRWDRRDELGEHLVATARFVGSAFVGIIVWPLIVMTLLMVGAIGLWMAAEVLLWMVGQKL